MIDCEHLEINQCLLATKHADCGIPVLTTESACSFCLTCGNPKSLNKAVASIAADTLLRSGKFDANNSKHSAIQNVLTVEPSGPGTELRKLISWFPIPNKNGCRTCRNLELKMNRWGSETCEAKISYILRKLRIAAARRSIPFSESLTKVLVRKAIRNAR